MQLTEIRCNLSKTTTLGPVLTDLYRARGGCSTEVDYNALVLFGTREAGCFREVAALHSNHFGWVSLYVCSVWNIMAASGTLTTKRKPEKIKIVFLLVLFLNIYGKFDALDH